MSVRATDVSIEPLSARREHGARAAPYPGGVDLVVWECPVHGVVDEWPDDGSPESRGATSPHFPVCPGPWDEDLNNWTYKCERKLRRRVHTD
jgi:hypothetical protein